MQLVLSKKRAEIIPALKHLFQSTAAELRAQCFRILLLNSIQQDHAERTTTKQLGFSKKHAEIISALKPIFQ